MFLPRQRLGVRHSSERREPGVLNPGRDPGARSSGSPTGRADVRPTDSASTRSSSAEWPHERAGTSRRTHQSAGRDRINSSARFIKRPCKRFADRFRSSVLRRTLSTLSVNAVADTPKLSAASSVLCAAHTLSQSPDNRDGLTGRGSASASPDAAAAADDHGMLSCAYSKYMLARWVRSTCHRLVSARRCSDLLDRERRKDVGEVRRQFFNRALLLLILTVIALDNEVVRPRSPWVDVDVREDHHEIYGNGPGTRAAERQRPDRSHPRSR